MRLMLERVHRWGEVSELINSGEFDYFFEKPNLEKEKIAWKNESTENTIENFKKIIEILESITDSQKKEDETEEAIKKIENLAEEKGKGGVLWPLRYALSGKEKSPSPFDLMRILGTEESADRIKKAIEILS